MGAAALMVGMKKSIKNKLTDGVSESQTVVVIFRNSRHYDQFAVSYLDPEGKVLKKGLYKQQYEFKLSSAFKAKFLRLVNNNCFVVLYDKT